MTEIYQHSVEICCCTIKDTSQLIWKNVNNIDLNIQLWKQISIKALQRVSGQIQIRYFDIFAAVSDELLLSASVFMLLAYHPLVPS